MKLHMEYEQENAGRWIAAIPQIPGVMCYGVSRNDAAATVEALTLKAIASRLDEGEMTASLNHYWDSGKHPNMNQWSSLKAGLMLAALVRIGWWVSQATDRTEPATAQIGRM